MIQNENERRQVRIGNLGKFPFMKLPFNIMYTV